MEPTPRLYRFVKLANTLLFTTALAVMLDQSVAAAFDRFQQIPHWSSEDRAIVVIDKTGDKAWQAATKAAVGSWNTASGRTGLRLTWSTGSGGCTPSGNRVEICQTPYQTLGDDMHAGDREGLTDLRLGSDRAQAHIGGLTIAVCSNCRVDAARRRVIAVHELGHGLGLEHNLRVGSVMYPTGGRPEPDAEDAATLGALYGHVDEGDRCGLFDARLGPLCF